MSNQSSSIRALVKLIDDPDEGIYNHVRDELIKCGSKAIPYLEKSWEDEYYGLVFQNRIENIIHDIQFEDIKGSLRKWNDCSEKDLLEGAIIVARYQYPGLIESEIRDYIQSLRRDIWLELNDHLTAFEQVKVFNRIFFKEHKFYGDSKNYHSPVNSYINSVIESKKGNPLSICLVYSIVAQSLDLPIYGVNLPNHFVLAYIDEKGSGAMINQENEYGVLFYINAFSNGVIFNTNEIRQFLKELKLEQRREFFEPCSNSAIIKRMLTNLISSFQRVGNSEKVDELKILRNIIEGI
jgi:regulator of sirC expression with transglutaminase-like and TPR domain